MSGLLNPTVEADVCKKMIEKVSEMQAQLHAELTGGVLDHETYLMKIGAARSLNTALLTMNAEYGKHFNV